MSDQPCYICQAGSGWPYRVECCGPMCRDHAADLRAAGWVPASEVEQLRRSLTASRLAYATVTRKSYGDAVIAEDVIKLRQAFETLNYILGQLDWEAEAYQEAWEKAREAVGWTAGWDCGTFFSPESLSDTEAKQ